MKLALAIGIGSFCGGIFRYLLSQLLQNKLNSSFPIGTLIVNLSGCFLIGIIYDLAQRNSISNEWRLIISTGLIGGFTTFSAFSLESLNLFRDGNYSYAIIYITTSVIVGLIATLMGIWVIKYLL